MSDKVVPGTLSLFSVLSDAAFRSLFVFFFNWANCFTLLCWLLPYSMNRRVGICICPLWNLPPTPPPHATSSGLSQSTRLICMPSKSPGHLFTYAGVCASVLLSQFVPPSPSPDRTVLCARCPANMSISAIFLDAIYPC